VHPADAGHHPIGGQVAGGGVGEQPVLDEVTSTIVTEEGDALAHELLAGGGVAVVVLGRPTLADLVGQGGDLVGAAHGPTV
jgi:hypothetical protein